MPRAVLEQKGLENPYFAISRPWGSDRPKLKMSESCAISGRNFWGGRIFSPKVPLAPGNCAFLFLTGARNFSKCPQPKTGQNPSKSPFATTWGSDRKKLFTRKLRKTVPDSVVTFFFRFWDPFCSADQKGPCGASLLVACCLLVACLLLACCLLVAC